MCNKISICLKFEHRFFHAIELGNKTARREAYVTASGEAYVRFSGHITNSEKCSCNNCKNVVKDISKKGPDFLMLYTSVIQMQVYRFS